MKTDLLLEQQTRATKKRVGYAFYGIALACCIVSVLAARKDLQPTIWSNFFAVICAGSLTCGFIIRTQTVVVQIWKSVFGKLLLALSSAFVAVLASLPARHVVASAIHLPVGDFPATLTFWTILCYPAVGIALAIAILFVAYVLLLTIAALTVFSIYPPLDWFIRGAADLLPSQWTSHKRLVDGRGKFAMVVFADAFAAGILSIVAAYSLTGWYRTVNQPNLVRIFAYWADYEAPTDYPGTEKESFRLLENGVVSYARPENYDIRIRVACLKGLVCPQQ